MSDSSVDLANVPIFQGLTPDELDALRQRIELRRFRPGDTLIEVGCDLAALFVVKSGLVSAVLGSGPQERQVATLGKGECVGEMALITGEPPSATVRAVTEGEVWLLDRECFVDFLEKRPAIWGNLGRILSQRLVRTTRSASGTSAELVALVSDCPDGQASELTAAAAQSLARQTGKRTLAVDARMTSSYPLSRVASVEKAPSLEETLRDKSLLSQHETPPTPSGAGCCRVASLNANGERPVTDDFLAVLDWLQPLYDFIVILVRPDLGGLPAPVLERMGSIVAVITGLLDESGPPWLADLMADEATERKLHPAVISGGYNAAALERLEDRLGGAVVRLKLGQTELESLAAGGWAGRGQSEALASGVDQLARRIGQIEVGLALGAGAAKGFAHIGVLRVLEEERVPIDYIAGCSIGAVVGGMYAYGLPLEEIARTMRGADRKLRRWTIPFRSIWSDAGLKDLLRAPAPTARFRDLKLPFAVVATDVATGRETVIRKGVVWRAVQASTSVPGIFPAALLHGRPLVDGGLVNPVPSQTARGLGADLVIAVDLMSPAARAERDDQAAGAGSAFQRAPNLVEMLWRANEIMQEEVAFRSAATADVTIEPRLGSVRWSDFSNRGREFTALGEEAARAKMPEIRQLLPAISIED